MNSPSLQRQFELLRLQIESATEFPAALVVSSACAGDGKSVTAFGLARSLVSAGYRCVLMDANHLAPSVQSSTGPANLEQLVESGPQKFAQRSVDGNLDVISIARDSLRESASRPTVARAVTASRSEYDLVVVDTAPLLESNLGMLFAMSSDVLILTVREGRKILKADRDLIETLKREDISPLGMVTCSRQVIRDFYSSAVREFSSDSLFEATAIRRPAAG